MEISKDISPNKHNLDNPTFPVAMRLRDTPVPIPNTMVKP